MSALPTSLTWRRCAGLPVCEGEEIYSDLGGAMTVEEAVNAYNMYMYLLYT